MLTFYRSIADGEANVPSKKGKKTEHIGSPMEGTDMR